MLFFTYFFLVCSLSRCKSDGGERVTILDESGVTMNDDLALIDSIVQEPECSSKGGMCVVAEDCLGKLTEQRGLCPNQRSKGVECCYGISKKETRCEKVGGVCLPRDEYCTDSLVFREARDCFGQVCCIMVH